MTRISTTINNIRDEKDRAIYEGEITTSWGLGYIWSADVQPSGTVTKVHVFQSNGLGLEDADLYEAIIGAVRSAEISFQQSLDLFNEKVAEFGISPIEARIARADFGIQGGEDEEMLLELASDWANDLHTEDAEAKDAWRYEH